MIGRPPPRRGLFHLPLKCRMALRRWGGRCTRRLLVVVIRRQVLIECSPESPGGCRIERRLLISTSRFGVGQHEGSHRTPLGLHRVARKIGDGHPIGTVFKGRRAVGLTRNGWPDAPICHRILWLEGLEPGHNRGGTEDSFHRYIYIHGFGDEVTLGRPASHGCIHVSASDLLPLYDRTPVGTLVWIDE